MTECVIVLRFCKSNIRLSPRVCVCVCVCVCLCLCVCVGGVRVGEEVERNHFYGDFEKQI